MKFCEKLADTMKLDEIAGEAGLDVNGEALLARAKQLVKLEVCIKKTGKSNLTSTLRKCLYLGRMQTDRGWI